MNLLRRISTLVVPGGLALVGWSCGDGECSSVGVELELRLEPPPGVVQDPFEVAFDVEVVGLLSQEGSVLQVTSEDDVAAAVTISGANLPTISSGTEVRLRLVAGELDFLEGAYVEMTEVDSGALLFAAYAGAPLTVPNARVAIDRQLACEVVHEDEEYGDDYVRYYRVVATVDGVAVTADAGASLAVGSTGLVVDHQGTFETELFDEVSDSRTAVLVYAE